MSISAKTTPGKTLPLVTRELGVVEQTFRPPVVHIVVGFPLVVLLVYGGWVPLLDLATGGSLSPGSSRLDFVEVCALGIVLCAVVTAITLWVWQIRSSAVYLCRQGVAAVGRNKIDIFPWAQLEYVEETVGRERVPFEGVPGRVAPFGGSRVYTLQRRDGTQASFDDASVKKIRTLGRLLRAAADRHGVLWRTTAPIDRPAFQASPN
jgi:hypothetical protein